jgi:hypothetical protein
MLHLVGIMLLRSGFLFSGGSFLLALSAFMLPVSSFLIAHPTPKENPLPTVVRRGRYGHGQLGLLAQHSFYHLVGLFGLHLGHHFVELGQQCCAVGRIAFGLLLHAGQHLYGR